MQRKDTKYYLNSGEPLKKACEREDISYPAVLQHYYRFNKTIDEAFEYKLKWYKEKRSQAIYKINGKSVYSQQGSIPVSLSMFRRYMLKNNCTAEEAYSYYTSPTYVNKRSAQYKKSQYSTTKQRLKRILKTEKKKELIKKLIDNRK